MHPLKLRKRILNTVRKSVVSKRILSLISLVLLVLLSAALLSTFVIQGKGLSFLKATARATPTPNAKGQTNPPQKPKSTILRTGTTSQIGTGIIEPQTAVLYPTREATPLTEEQEQSIREWHARAKEKRATQLLQPENRTNIAPVHSDDPPIKMGKNINLLQGSSQIEAASTIKADILRLRTQNSQKADPVLEPSVATAGNKVLYTANHLAGVSSDGGQTFSFIDPYKFPRPANGDSFCCDQVAYAIPQQNLILWTIQYGDPARSNTLRLAFATGNKISNDVTTWSYLDFTPQQLGFSDQYWVDYNAMTASAEYIYITTNVFAITGASGGSTSVILRIRISDLIAGGAVPYTRDKETFNGLDSIKCVEGARTTMYCGALIGDNIKILRWDDNPMERPFFKEIALDYYTGLSKSGEAVSPDGTNWAAFANTKIHAAFRTGGRLGFAWGARQTKGRPYPYTILAQFDEQTFEKLDQIDIWSQDFGILYPNIAVNAAGNLGMIAGAGGGSFYPRTLYWQIDDFNMDFSNNVVLVESTNGPKLDRWGDYITVRPHPIDTNTFVVATYYQEGAHTNAEDRRFIVPVYARIGRERDFNGTCTYAVKSLTPRRGVQGEPDMVEYYGVNGGAGQAEVTTTSACPWHVSNLPDWVYPTTTTTRTGSGFFQYTVPANPSLQRRSATFSVAGKSHQVIQSGSGDAVIVNNNRNVVTSIGELEDNDAFTVPTEGSRPYYTDYFQYAFEEGQVVAFEVTATGFSPVLTLFDSSGASIATITGNRLPAGIGTIPIPKTGNYRLAVSSTNFFATGTYRVTRFLPSVAKVDDLVDTPDATMGDGICADANGKCTLRAAMQEANSNTFRRIEFVVNGTILLTSALPNILTDVAIWGPGADKLTVQRSTGGNYRIFTNNTGKTVSIAYLTIANGNVTTEGGGIWNNGTLQLYYAAVTGNKANGGGGVYNVGTLTGEYCTISGNTANFDGAGLYNTGNARASLFNCTISGNTGGTSFNGGIMNAAASGQSARLTLTTCTVTANSGASAINTLNFNTATNVTTELSNTLVAGNTGANFARSGSNTVITSLGYNLDSDGTSGFSNGQNGNLVGTTSNKLDAKLGALANNGGPTLTHALLVGSPAIDKGNATVSIDKDQRGNNRPIDLSTIANATGGDGSDIGAFELLPVYDVTDAGDGDDVAAGNGVCADSAGKCTLRAAITEANALKLLQSKAASITVSLLKLTGMINLTRALPDLSGNVTIAGPGPKQLEVRRTGTADYRIFTLAPGANVTISGLKLTNGRSDDGAGIQNERATLTLERCELSGNLSPGIAGGIYSEGGQLNITKSTIANNTAAAGGGIVSINGGLAMANSTISGNFGDTFGGIAAVMSTITLHTCTISGNKTKLGASALYHQGENKETAFVDFCTIADNTGGDAAIMLAADGTDSTKVATLGLSSTLVANNDRPNFVKYGIARNNLACLYSNGNNLDSDGTGLFSSSGKNDLTINVGDPFKLDPQLGPLADNGGETKTHALLFGSPAIDKGLPIPRVSAAHTDQRGRPRVRDGNADFKSAPDIGAYELHPLYVGGTSDSNSGLRRDRALSTIAHAISVAQSGDVLLIAQGVFNEAQLYIDKPLTLQGVKYTETAVLPVVAAAPTTTIHARQMGRVIFVLPGVTVSLRNLTITGGKTGSEVGGGILSGGTLYVTNCLITQNTSDSGGGGIASAWGGLIMTNSTVSGNTGANGAGIYNSTGGQLMLTGVTISGNSGKNASGLLNVDAPGLLTNCTISGNQRDVSSGGDGVGIAQVSSNNSPFLLEMINCTIADNVCPEGVLATAGNGASLSFKNTLIAGNSGPNFYPQSPKASLVTQGNNLDSDGTSGFVNGTKGDIVGTTANKLDARLAWLGDNGGLTRTHALLPGSPALEKGNNQGIPATDQRGIAHPQDSDGDGVAAVDIGAFEARTRFVSLATGNDNNNGATKWKPFKTLARALGISTGLNPSVTPPESDILIVGPGTYPEHDLVISKSLIIQGAGAATTIIDAQQAGRIFTIPSGTYSVNISDLTITNGKVINNQSGGGISNSAALTLTRCVVRGNSAPTGGGNGAGGIDSSGDLRIHQCTISDNSGLYTGGIYQGSFQGKGGLEMTDSTISGNQCLITPISVPFLSSGLTVYFANAKLTNCTISGNQAAGTIGAITHNAEFDPYGSSTVTLFNCTVTANTGSGIYTAYDSDTKNKLVLTNTLVAGNAGANFVKQGSSIVTSGGNNLDSDGTSGFVNNTKGDIVGTAAAKIDAKMLPLGFYGGATQTHPLLCDSPAINKGTSTGAPPTDQRGLPRPAGSAVDIGAVEADLSLTITPTSLPVAGLGKAYGPVTLTAANGTGPYQFLAFGLPAGLTLSSTGVLSGTPSASAPTSLGFTVLAVDARGKQICQNYSLAISSAPSITSLRPALVGAGNGAFTLRVSGVNFTGGQVHWNGVPKTTSATEVSALDAQVSAADVEKIGTASITVYHPATGLTSNALPFSIVNLATSVSGASYQGQALAPESIVSVFGVKLATDSQAAPSVPLPTTLAGTTVQVTDSLGTERAAPLFYVSPTQVNYQVPPGTAPGLATVSVRASDGTLSAGQVRVLAVAPGLFTATSDGKGIASAYITRVKGDGTFQDEPIARFDPMQNKVVAIPIDLGPATDRVFLVAFGTGLRGRTSLANTSARIGGVNCRVDYVGPSPGYVGLDQTNVFIERILIGRGEVDFFLTTDGSQTNPVKVSIK